MSHKLFLANAILLFACIVGLLVIVPQIGYGNVLDTHLFSVPKTIAKMRPDQIAAHVRLTSTVDMILPTAYGLLLFQFIRRKSQKLTIVCLPFVATLFDYVENFCVLELLNGGEPYVFKFTATALKFAILIIVFVILFLRRKENLECPNRPGRQLNENEP